MYLHEVERMIGMVEDGREDAPVVALRIAYIQAEQTKLLTDAQYRTAVAMERTAAAMESIAKRLDEWDTAVVSQDGNTQYHGLQTFKWLD